MESLGKLDALCALFALLTICAGMAMGVAADFERRDLPNGLSSPVFAMQLIENDREMVVKILGSTGDPSVQHVEMVEQITIDWVFIGFYTALFITVAIALHRRESRVSGFWLLSSQSSRRSSTCLRISRF